MKQLLLERLKKAEEKQEAAQAMAQQMQPPKAEGKPDLKKVG